MLSGGSVRRTVRSSVTNGAQYNETSASHALVDFGDEGTTIIPFSRIVCDKSALAEHTGSMFVIIMRCYMQ